MNAYRKILRKRCVTRACGCAMSFMPRGAMLKSSVEGSTWGAFLVGPPGVLRRSLRMSRRKLELGESGGRQSLGALSALQPARRVECSLQAQLPMDRVPLGLEKGIVETMSRTLAA